MKWSLHLGIHHDAWKRSIMVIIPKPNKPSYSAPGVYRPIQLLECLGKLLEKIVVKRLMFDCSRYHLISPECQGHSSLDAPSELNPPQRIPSLLLLHY